MRPNIRSLLTLINLSNTNVPSSVSRLLEPSTHKSGLNSLTQVRFKGHSHWQNVLKSKLAGDQLKSQITAQYCNRVRVAVRDHGPDPNMNSQLERVMIDAMSHNVSKETLLRVIKNAVEKPIQTFYIDYKGPGGSYFIIEGVAVRRTDIVFHLNGWLHKVPGGFNNKDPTVKSYFEHVGKVQILKESAPPIKEDRKETKKGWNTPPPINYPPTLSFEDAETLAIEVNALSVNAFTDDEGREAYEIICDPDHIKRIENELTAKHYAVLNASPEYRPLSRIRLSAQHMQYVDQFYQAVEKVDCIQAVFDNVQYEDEEN